MQLQHIQQKIYEIRGMKVMFDFDLAQLYQTETRILKQAVKRNRERFPEDFMFELDNKEVNSMVSQDVIPTKSYFGGAQPYVFTAQGVAMLSTVLKNSKAIEVNISIMRAFVFLRQYALTHHDLTEQLKAMESKYNKQFKDVYEAINYLLEKDKKPSDAAREAIGFKQKK